MLETILVIDDDAESTQSIGRALETKDYLVFSAGGEETAITLARKANPKVIFINPAVAGGKGLEICKKIHGMEQLKNVPIIVLSAFEGARDPYFTSLYGIVDSLQKPFSTEALFSKTRDALSLKPSDMQPAVHEVEAAEEDFPEETTQTSVNSPEHEEQPSATEDPPDYGLKQEETTGELESPYASKRTVRVGGAKTKLPVALIAAVVIVMLCAIGFMFYNKSSLFETKVQEPVKPVQPLQQEAARNNPSTEIQKSQQSAAETQPVSKPETAVTPPVAAKPTPKAETPVEPQAVEKPEIKPRALKSSAAKKTEAKEAGKTVYSVQVGVFKNKKNASVYAKSFEKKGYEVSIHKTGAGERKVLYRVLIGKFTARQEAANWSRKIASEERIKTTVFKR